MNPGECKTTRATLLALIPLSSFCGGPQLLAAETGLPPVEEIVVTSSRIPLPMRRIATSVSVITAEDIEAHGNFSLTDVLRQLPGISTSSNGGTGNTTSLRIRGEEAFRTLTIFDGIRLSDPSSPQIGPQLQHILSSGVARVEVLRGPQGLGYGADAGGILNISSRHGEQGLQAELDVEGGKFGARQYSANAGGGNERADFFLAVADFRSDGFNVREIDDVLRDDDGYRNTTVHVRGGLEVTEKLRLELVHRDVDGDTEHDACSFSATVHDCNSLFGLQATRVALEYDSDAISHAVSYATSSTERESMTGGVSTFLAEGELNRWEYAGSATHLPGFDLVFGADFEEAVNNGDSRDNTGVYLEYLSDFSERLYFTAGARHDDNDDFGSNTSYRVSSAYLVDLGAGGTLKFKGSYGTGFRAPSPFEIAYNAGPSAFPPAAGTELKQETSRGHEFGAEYRRDEGLRLEAIYFDQEVEDAIYFDVAGFSGYLQDSGTGSSQGVELTAELDLGENWRVNANYTYNDTGRPNGRPRLRRPENQANIGLSWYSGNGRLNFNGFYRISRDSVDESGGTLVPLDDFEVLDLTGSIALSDAIQVYGRLENALDENYQEIAGYRTAGRAAYLGLRFSYQGL